MVAAEYSMTKEEHDALKQLVSLYRINNEWKPNTPDFVKEAYNLESR